MTLKAFESLGSHRMSLKDEHSTKFIEHSEMAATSQNSSVVQMQAVAVKLAGCANCESIAQALSTLAFGRTCLLK